jgi:hypothetical protein
MPGVSVHRGVEATANPKPGSVDTARGIDRLSGPGRCKWNSRTELHAHLVKHMGPVMAKRVTSAWYHEATGLWAGPDLNRVRHGKPPHGKVIGRG